jgi:hypothetical protein
LEALDDLVGLKPCDSRRPLTLTITVFHLDLV